MPGPRTDYCRSHDRAFCQDVNTTMIQNRIRNHIGVNLLSVIATDNIHDSFTPLDCKSLENIVFNKARYCVGETIARFLLPPSDNTHLAKTTQLVQMEGAFPPYASIFCGS